MSLQPQWSVDRTVNGTMTLAEGVLRAATTDNVQVLAILACEKFGNTLAISGDTMLKIEKSVVPAAKPALLNFIEATIGYAANDSVHQLGRSAAGLRFLSLAAALVTTMGSFKAGLAIQTLIESTAKDKTLVPTVRHITNLLDRLEPRCHQAGFAEDLAGWQILISRVPDDSLFTQISDNKNWSFPQTKGIENLVEAFRQLSRIGDASVSKVTVSTVYCAPWTVAFAKWCLGYSPSIVFEDGSPILEQPNSNVQIIVPRHGDPGQFIVTVYSTIDGPSQLIGPRMDRPYVGMVGIHKYGLLLRQYYRFDDEGTDRVIRQCLPYAIQLASQNVLSFGSPETMHPGLAINAKAAVPASNNVSNLRLSPFPEERTIWNAQSLLFGYPEPEAAPILPDGFLLSDLPLVDLHLRKLKEKCHCLKCSPDSQKPRLCEKITFFKQLSIAVADVLALSLFDRPEDLLVSSTLHRSQRNTGDAFVNAIDSVITGKGKYKCFADSILEWAMLLVGHSRDQEVPRIISSCMGQAVWLTIFETKLYSKHGYLRLSWVPGMLLYKGESYDICSGALYSRIGKDPITDICNDAVLQPRNLCPRYQLKWNMSSTEAGLVTSLGLQKDTNAVSEGALNPLRIIENLAQAFLVGPCPHDAHSMLSVPDPFCAFTGPFKPIKKSSGLTDSESLFGGYFMGMPRRTAEEPIAASNIAALSVEARQRAAVESIWVAAVDGSDELRFFSLANNMVDCPVVLRWGACLACCLDVCREVGTKGYAALIL